MSTIETGTRFLRRFDDVWMRLKRVGLLKAVSLGTLMVITGIVLLVVCDFTFELPYIVRAVGLTLVLATSFGVMATRIYQEFRRWSQRHTAATIEKNFPELGQSVRTAIEFGETDEQQLKDQGVVPGLVTAMQQQTDRVTLPLDLLGIVKTGGLIAMVGALCFLLGSLITGSAVNFEWRTALRRAFLSNVAYTTTTSPSGDLTVIEGGNAMLSLEVFGRTDREVTLLTRAADDSDGEWLSRVLTGEDRTASVENNDRYQFEIAEIAQPFDYRFSAGPASTPQHRVTVKYKLKIEDVSVTTTPPEYTQLPPKTKSNTSLTAIENSKIVFDVTFDRPPAAAKLLLRPMRRSSNLRPVEIPLVSKADTNGETYSTEMDVTGDWRFTVHAVDEDDVAVESPEYSIRMRRDQAPKIWFEEPSEELEVHTLAEIMLRIRVTDDFGLATAGIVFEINNESEHTLISKAFASIAEELKKDGLAEDGRIKPKTRDTIEKLLPLEFFELTERDSVNYYAFATDNYPDGAHETTTDLRFIDIRPFRRTYEVIDPDDPMAMPGAGGEKLIFLGELIKRERALLNRTRRVATRAEAGSLPDTTTTSSLIEEQQTIADATLRLVDFLIQRNFGGDELLFDAHEVMLTVIDQLAAGEFSNSVALERDAIKLLVEGRNTLEMLIRKNPAKARAALRAFSRREAQKLRRPKSDEEEIAELVERLRQLKRQEGQVYAATQAMGSNGQGVGTNGDGDPNGPAESELSDEEMDALDQLTSETEDRQNDAAVEARDIEGRMDSLEMLTDLARERMAEAASLAEESAASFDKQDPKEAGETANDAGAKFGQLADQVDALLKDEIAQRIAAARDLANKLAQQQQQMQTAMNAQGKSGRRGNSGNPGGTGPNGTQGMGGGQTGKPSEDAEDSEANNGDEPKGEDGTGDDEDQDGERQDGDGRDDGEDGDKDEGEPESGSGSEQSDAAESGSKGSDADFDGDTGTGEAEDSEKAGGNGKGADEPESDQPSGSGTDSEEDAEEAGGGDSESDQESLKALAAMARQLEQDGKTLEDLLKSIARSSRQEDQEAAGAVSRIIDEQRISETLEQMGDVAQMVEDGDVQGAKTVSSDIGNRLQLTSQDLERLHQRIVSPRIDALMKLERRAVALLEKAKEMESQEDAAQWQRAARELLDEITDAKLTGNEFKDLEDALRGTASDYGARRTNYVDASQIIVKKLQQRIQEMVLGDVIDQSDEAVPPEYERLVERYYQVLSDERKDE